MTAASPSHVQDNRTVDACAHIEPGEELIKSRQRVKAHGEVFTPRRMVDQMLDLVSAELETGPHFVDKTFFEPAFMRKSGVSRDIIDSELTILA
mgnify:CR=1 FL=1